MCVLYTTLNVLILNRILVVSGWTVQQHERYCVSTVHHKVYLYVMYSIMCSCVYCTYIIISLPVCTVQHQVFVLCTASLILFQLHSIMLIPMNLCIIYVFIIWLLHFIPEYTVQVAGREDCSSRRGLANEKFT